MQKSLCETALLRIAFEALRILRGAVKKYRFERKPYWMSNNLKTLPYDSSTLGKQMYDVIRFDPHKPSYKADLEADYCDQDLIESQFIGNLYRNAGYRTMIAEDWAQYALNFLNCTGFKSPPADHYLK